MPKPFDLQKAKEGHPLVDSNNKLVRFLQHVPEASEEYRVLFLKQDGTIHCCTESGTAFSSKRLFLADTPMVKKEWFIAVYKIHGLAYVFSSFTREGVEGFLKENPNRSICGEIIHHTWEEPAS